MDDSEENKNDNDNRLRIKFKTVRGLAKELGWLKKEQRACHFFLFLMIKEYSTWAELSIKNDADLSRLSALGMDQLKKIIIHSDGQLKQADPGFSPLPAQIPNVLLRHMNAGLGIESEVIENTAVEEVQEVSAYFNTSEQLNNGNVVSKLPPEDILFANGLSTARLKHIQMIKNCFYSVIEHFLLGCSSDKQRLDVIAKITLLWGSCRQKHPSPFSWLNSKNKEHCQWLWDEMHKRCIGIPFLPRDHIQQWYFIVATFDNWKGWTMAQQTYLTEKNPKRNPDKLFSGGQDPDRIEFEHKMLLLDELRKAWEQKQRRSRRAREPAVAKLTQAAQKKLEFIAHLEKTTSKDILNDLINNAFNDAMRKSQLS